MSFHQRASHTFLPRRTCLRLILFCICPPLCAGVLWPMPAWVWRDVQSVFFFFFFGVQGVVSAIGSLVAYIGCGA